MEEQSKLFDTSYIKTEDDWHLKDKINELKTRTCDFTFTRETQNPWIDYSYRVDIIKKALTDEQLINLTKPTMSRQHKIAVFTVTRNEKNEIISSEFYKEGWIELDNDQHVALIAAKKFNIPVDLFDSIVVKKIHEVTL